MLKRLVVGNWKMNLGANQARELVTALLSKRSAPIRSEVWIAPPNLHLSKLSELVRGSAIKLGAQNVHWENSGAFTGEISKSMLLELGVGFALAGHSERRHVFAESNELAAKRARVASTDFKVIFCIGETSQERESAQTEAILASQLKALTNELTAEIASGLILAYEPVWAIGTGKVASSEDIRNAHAFIDQYWRSQSKFPTPAILYGGSVAPDNFEAIVRIPLVSGALVGGASLVFEKFSKLIEIAEAA